MVCISSQGKVVITAKPGEKLEIPDGAVLENKVRQTLCFSFSVPSITVMLYILMFLWLFKSRRSTALRTFEDHSSNFFLPLQGFWCNHLLYMDGQELFSLNFLSLGRYHLEENLSEKLIKCLSFGASLYCLWQGFWRL